MRPADRAVTDKPADLDQVRRAARRLAGRVLRTPVLRSAALDACAGVPVYLKCEQFQTGGAFKLRGALNAVLSLSPADRAPGVATHSSGNHGQALARAAKLLGIPARIVMPRNAVRVKRQAVESQGAQIIDCDPGMAGREAALKQVVRETGAQVVHPYNDWRVIAGQGTASLELVQAARDITTLLAPVGGGGLLAGACLAAQSRRGIRVLGAEPVEADDAARALATGRIEAVANPATVADGLRATLGERPFRIIRAHAAGILTVDEAEILAAMRFVWNELKLVIEPSAAVPIALLLTRRMPLDGPVGVILSGGNVDLDQLPWGPIDGQ